MKNHFTTHIATDALMFHNFLNQQKTREQEARDEKRKKTSARMDF